jgi:hypothetical protein
MKRVFAVAVVVMLGSVAVPSSAQAETCLSGSTQGACQQLSECYVVGATLLLTAPADAVRFYRNCMSLERGYRLHKHNSGFHAHRRTRRLRATQSTFWPLYCLAQRRAGHRNDRLCRRTHF